MKYVVDFNMKNYVFSYYIKGYWVLLTYSQMVTYLTNLKKFLLTLKFLGVKFQDRILLTYSFSVRKNQRHVWNRKHNI